MKHFAGGKTFSTEALAGELQLFGICFPCRLQGYGKQLLHASSGSKTIKDTFQKKKKKTRQLYMEVFSLKIPYMPRVVNLDPCVSEKEQMIVIMNDI